MKIARLCLALMMMAGVGFVGCAVEAGGEGDLDAEALDAEIASPGFETKVTYPQGTTDSVSGGKYTHPTSEEFPPVFCPKGQAAVGAHCDGAFCDNYQLICKPLESGKPDWDQLTIWTNWFEHDGKTSASCPDSTFVDGVECRGGNCDDIRLRCRQFYRTPKDCLEFSNQSTWHSEETSPWRVSGERYMVGALCNGRHCDNKKYRQCEAE